VRQREWCLLALTHPPGGGKCSRSLTIKSYRRSIAGVWHVGKYVVGLYVKYVKYAVRLYVKYVMYVADLYAKYVKYADFYTKTTFFVS
jgi:hypothetical protein